MAPVVVATARAPMGGKAPRIGNGNIWEEEIGRAVPSRITTHLRGSACTPAALRTHGISPGVGHRETLREGRASRGRRRARVVRPSPYRTTTTPRKNAAVFSRGDSRHENEKAFRRNTRIEKTRSGRFRGSTSAVKRRSMTPLDRRDAGHRSFTDRLGFHVASACLSMTAALAPRNTSRDGLKIPNEISPHRETRISRFVRDENQLRFFLQDTLRLAPRSASGRDNDPPRLARPCDYVRLRAGGRSRTPLTCWRP